MFQAEATISTKASSKNKLAMLNRGKSRLLWLNHSECESKTVLRRAQRGRPIANLLQF